MEGRGARSWGERSAQIVGEVSVHMVWGAHMRVSVCAGIHAGSSPRRAQQDTYR